MLRLCTLVGQSGSDKVHQHPEVQIVRVFQKIGIFDGSVRLVLTVSTRPVCEKLPI